MKPLRNRTRAAFRLGLAILGLAVLTTSASAQITDAQKSAIRGNCRSDFMAKCSGVTPGGKDALLCLQKNVDSLSPGCKTAVSATIPAPAPARCRAITTARAAPSRRPHRRSRLRRLLRPPTVTSAPPPPAKVEQAERPASTAEEAGRGPPPKQAVARALPGRSRAGRRGTATRRRTAGCGAAGAD